MARTTIALKSLSLNSGTVISETTVAAGATGTGGYAFTGVERDTDFRLEIENTDGSSTGAFEIVSGDYQSESAGKLTVYVGPELISALKLDGSRFRQDDANIDLNTVGVTGIVRAYQ